MSGQGSGNWTVSQTYDEADRIDTLTYPTGETVTYGYSDRTGLPTSLDSNQGDVIVASATLYGAGSAPYSAVGHLNRGQGDLCVVAVQGRFVAVVEDQGR